MSTTNLHIHDVTPEQYAALALPESSRPLSAWKVLDTPSISITFFRPVPEARPDA